MDSWIVPVIVCLFVGSICWLQGWASAKEKFKDASKEVVVVALRDIWRLTFLEPSVGNGFVQKNSHYFKSEDEALRWLEKSYLTGVIGEMPDNAKAVIATPTNVNMYKDIRDDYGFPEELEKIVDYVMTFTREGETNRVPDPTVLVSLEKGKVHNV